MRCPRCGKDNPPDFHTCTPLALKLAAQADQLSLGEIAAELRRLHEAHEWQYTMAGERLRRIEKLEAALSSIAKNTCCDRCQEAALVARAALTGGKT